MASANGDPNKGKANKNQMASCLTLMSTLIPMRSMKQTPAMSRMRVWKVPGLRVQGNRGGTWLFWVRRLLAQLNVTTVEVDIADG